MGITLLNLLVIFNSLLVCHEIASIQSSKEEHFNFEKQYQPQNESIGKSIKAKYRSIYDCVDFYKQPAFSHPSLKGHNFHHEMTPKFGLGDERATKSCPACQQNNTLFHGMALEGGGCPTGTVPIKRISKNDFIQMNKFTKDYATRIKTNKIQPQPGTHVNPSINKDNDKHLFQYLDAGQLHCFNTLCPGFVVTSKEISIDSKLLGDSKRGGPQYIITVIVYQDVKDGNWWLEVDGLVVGFWPRHIFKKLGNGATYIAVGGEAYSPSDQPLPPMGNGYYPVEDVNLSAYCSNLTVLDANHQWVDPKNTETYVNDNHYGVYDMGQAGWYGRLVYYGGTTLWA